MGRQSNNNIINTCSEFADKSNGKKSVGMVFFSKTGPTFLQLINSDSGLCMESLGI